MTGHQDHFSFRRVTLHPCDHVDTSSVGQAQIGNYKIEFRVAEDSDRVSKRVGGQHFQPGLSKDQA
jgi:hypothetical protein